MTSAPHLMGAGPALWLDYGEFVLRRPLRGGGRGAPSAAGGGAPDRRAAATEKPLYLIGAKSCCFQHAKV